MCEIFKLLNFILEKERFQCGKGFYVLHFVVYLALKPLLFPNKSAVKIVSCRFL